MIKIENTEVYGWEAAIRGMRNPMNSWDKSDSDNKRWCKNLGENEKPHYCNNCGYDFCNYNEEDAVFVIGENDLNLMKNLVKSGSDHSKFMRMITVTLDVTAPLYWWKEYDTYKIGTVRNSCSTMHKIAEKEFTLDDFSHEHLCEHSMRALKRVIDVLNIERNNYSISKKKWAWWQMIQLLPSSYNQRATLQLNYAVLRNMYHSRKNHKLDEWHDFCSWIESLPYAKELICDD